VTTRELAPPAAPPASVAAGLRHLARPWTARLVVAGVFVLAASVAELAPPLIVRHVIDANLLPHRTTGLALAGLAYLAAGAVIALLTAVYGYLAATVAQRSLATLRTRLFAHLLALPSSYHDHVPLGDSISRATADVEVIDDLFSSSAATLLAQTVQLITVLVAMVVLSPALTAVSLLVVPPVALITGYLRRRIRDAERATRTAVGTLNSQLHEDLTAIEVIRAFGRQDTFADRFRRALVTWLTAVNRSTYYNAFYAPLLAILSATATAMLLWSGGHQILGARAVTLGTLTAFVLLFARFFTPLINLGDEWQTVQAALAGAERVFTVLAIPAPPPTDLAAASPRRTEPESETASSPAPAVRMERVSFGYTPDRPVLHDITLTARPGEHVAIVGRTGAGKSTLLALLAGLYAPSNGRIELVGRDPRAFSDDERRATLGFVSQRVNLFSGTVYDNLAMGDQTFPHELVEHAAAIAGADPFIRTLAHGYDTVLAADTHGNGVHLSAGQRQLLALARALTTRPAVLLLDEATSVIDGASDAVFRAALREHVLHLGTAVVTIAHRLATARDAHRVVVMKGGLIIEQGTPTALLAADGSFAALTALEEAGWDWQHDPDAP
jgi:ATP-binding cassette subfamily B multidrug efflux pump